MYEIPLVGIYRSREDENASRRLFQPGFGHTSNLRDLYRCGSCGFVNRFSWERRVDVGSGLGPRSSGKGPVRERRRRRALEGCQQIRIEGFGQGHFTQSHGVQPN